MNNFIYTAAVLLAQIVGGTYTAQQFNTQSVITIAPLVTSAASINFPISVASAFIITTSGIPTPSLSVTGTLPTGVTFTDNGDGTGTISGTATSLGSSTVTITANNSILPNGTQSFTVNVVSVISGPQTYGARYDNCRTGTESGCTGASTGHTGSPLSYLGQPTDPMLWHNLDPANTMIVDPDFGAHQVVVTDRNTTCGSLTASWGLGSAGNHEAFSTDKAFLLISNNNGNSCIIKLNMTSLHNGTCATIPCSSIAAITQTNLPAICNPTTLSYVVGTNCTILQTNASFVWSTVPGEVHVIYELMNNNVVVNKLALNSTGTGFTRTPVVNFTSDWADAPNNHISAPCSLLPANFIQTWNGTFAVSNDGVIGYPLGGGQEWVASTGYSSDAFIRPSVNNTPGGGQAPFGFQSSGGTTGGTEPNWLTCTVTCTDGTITWTNIGHVGGQGSSTFYMINYDPIHGCRGLNTFLAKVFNGVNEGTGYPSSGVGADPVGLTTTDQAAALYNICTLSSSVSTCAASWPTHSGRETSIFPLHDGSIMMNGLGMVISPTGSTTVPTGMFAGRQSCKSNSGAENICAILFWERRTLMVRGVMEYTNVGCAVPYTGGCSSSSVYGKSEGHEIFANKWAFAEGQFVPHDYFNPNTDSGAPNSTAATLFAIGLTWDQHGTPRSTNSNDTVPLFMAMSQNPSVGRNTNSHNSGYNHLTLGAEVAGYNEIVAVSPVSTGCPFVGVSSATFCLYSFGHNWMSGSGTVLAIAQGTGVASKDGLAYAFGTDIHGMRGSSSPNWVNTTHSYLYGDMVSPTAVGNTNHSVYQNLTGATFITLPGSAQPNWGGCQASGCTVAGVNSGEIWTNVSAIRAPSNQGTIQLSCNDLEADYTSNSFPSTPAVGDRTLHLGDNNIFEVTAITGTMGTLPNFNTAGTCSSFAGTCQDSAAKVTFVNKGNNDCRGDVVVADLTSATR